MLVPAGVPRTSVTSPSRICFPRSAKPLPCLTSSPEVAKSDKLSGRQMNSNGGVGVGSAWLPGISHLERLLKPYLGGGRKDLQIAVAINFRRTTTLGW